MATSAFNTLVVRTLSGIVLLVVVVGAVLLSPYTMLALMLAICVGGMYEFYKLGEASGTQPQKCVGIAVGVIAVLLSFWMAVGNAMPGLSVAIALAVVLFFGIFAAELYRKKEKPLLNIAVTIAGIAYVALPLAMVITLPLLGGLSAESIGGGGAFCSADCSISYNPWILLLYIFLVWTNDIGAYLFGVTFGRHRLFERISPKKSWEGFFGGLATAVGMGVLFGWLLAPQGADPSAGMLLWGGLAVVVVVSGVLGDLVESMFKRSVGVKDSGRIMPGHGGWLDRFDALIYSAPFVFLYFTIFAV